MKKAKFILAAMLLSGILMYSCKKTESIVEETTKPVKPAEVEAFATKSIPVSCPFVDIASQPFNYVNGSPKANATCVDGVERLYGVHVPTTYNPAGNYPVVFLFHGHNQDMTAPYVRGWGWANLVDTKDIIVVTLQAWDNVMPSGRLDRRWHNPGLETIVANPADLKDDVGFVRQVYEVLKHNLAIDTGRVYASGFSNGSGFVKTRILAELDDVFAAATGAGGYGISTAFGFPTTEVARIPYFEVYGTLDNNGLDKCTPLTELPLLATDLMDPTFCLYDQHENILDYMNLSTTYTTNTFNPGAPNETTHLAFTTSTDPAFSNKYHFHLVKGNDHIYPNDYALKFWNWLKNKHK